MVKGKNVVGFCSGVLIAPTVVLSAGHCARNSAVPARVAAGNSIADFIPTINTSTLGLPRIRPEQTEKTINVNRFDLMDPEAVSAGEPLFGRDLMLVHLNRPFSNPIFPISIPSLDGINTAKIVRIVGFGENGHGATGKKLWADVDVLRARCNPDEPGEDGSSQCERGTELFARHSSGRFDSCPGDSGGPVYVRNEGGGYRLIGITSRAPFPSMECGGGTFVTLLDGLRLSWIKSIAPGVVVSGEVRPEAPQPNGDENCTPGNPPTCIR